MPFYQYVGLYEYKLLYRKELERRSTLVAGPTTSTLKKRLAAAKIVRSSSPAACPIFLFTPVAFISPVSEE
jgi:hypothetical protein